jgi:hypothetical protein
MKISSYNSTTLFTVKVKLYLTTNPFSNDHIISMGFRLGWYGGNHNASGVANHEGKFSMVSAFSQVSRVLI